MPRIKKENLPPLSTSLMRGETEQQYHAWLLYNETGSIERLLRAWQKVHQGYISDTSEIAGLRDRLNKPASLDAIRNWCRKFQWVKRTELLITEEMEQQKLKVERFRARRKFLVTDILMTKMNKLQKQARSESATVPEVKYLWEMHRTEFGESTGKTEVTHRIDESEQTPPDKEENEVGKEIDRVIKKHYDKRHK